MVMKLEIGGEEVPVWASTLEISDAIDERANARFTVIDADGSLDLHKGQPVEVFDEQSAGVWTGFVERLRRREIEGTAQARYRWEVLAVDNWYLADKRILARAYEEMSAGDIVRDIVDTLLVDEGIAYTAGSIDDGPTVQEAVFNWVPASRALKSLADRSNFWVYIDQDRVLFFKARDGVAAPWSLTRAEVRAHSMQLQESAPRYRNRQYVRGARTVTEFELTETHHGDGESRSFALGYRAHTVSKVEVSIDGGAFTEETSGVKGLDDDQWLWAFASETITQDAEETGLESVDRVRVTYHGLIDIIVLSQKGDEIAERSALEGVGSGIVDWVDDEPDMRDKDAAFQSANSKLEKYGEIGRVLRFQTRKAGLLPGQLLTVGLPLDGLDGVEMLVESVRLFEESRSVWYDVQAVEGPEQGSWESFFGDIAARSEIRVIRENVSEDEILIILKQYAKGWTETEEPNIFLIRVPDPDLVPSGDIVPAFAFGDRLKYVEVLEQTTENVLLRKILTTRENLDTQTLGESIDTMLFINAVEAVGDVEDIVWYGGWQATEAEGSGVEVARETQNVAKTSLEAWQVEREDTKDF